MPKKRLGIVFVGVVLLLVLVMGCENAPRSKALVVVNDSDAAVDYVNIQTFVFGRSMNPNSLPTDTEIAPGASFTFYLAPYSSTSTPGESVSLTVQGVSISFRYDYQVNGKNEKIVATFDGTSITVTGSGAVEDIT